MRVIGGILDLFNVCKRVRVQSTCSPKNNENCCIHTETTALTKTKKTAQTNKKSKQRYNKCYESYKTHRSSPLPLPQRSVQYIAGSAFGLR